MHKFVRNLITEWRRLGLPFKNGRVIAAVSGGADSTALLLALAELRRREKVSVELFAAHCNHKLRGDESARDERFVRRLAVELDIELIVGERPVKRRSDLEQAARDLRYTFLEETARQRNAELIVTAHTMNDQAETVLLNLIRGSGADGLSGMKPIRTLGTEGGNGAVRLARPMVRWARRSDSESFCEEMNTTFQSDTMNEDERFTRVRIRRQVIPLLAEFNPKIVETLARTAELMQHVDVPNDLSSSESISIADLKKLQRPEIFSRLRRWLRENRGDLRRLQSKHIEAIERLIKSTKSGRIVELPGGETVAKRGGRLAFRNNKLEN